MNDTLWPEFQELQQTLSVYFDALTDRVIEQALEVKSSEAEEQQQAAPPMPPQDHHGSLLKLSGANNLDLKTVQELQAWFHLRSGLAACE